MRAAIALVLVALAAAACGGGDRDLGDCPPDSAAQEMLGKEVVGARCATCHNSTVMGAGRAGAPSDVDFDTSEQARRHREEAWEQAESGAMPPGAKLMPQDLENLRVYFACGARI